MARCIKSPRIMPQSIAHFASNERLTWRKTHPHLYLFSIQSALKRTTILIINRLEKSLKTRVFAPKGIIIWNKGSFQKGFVKEYLIPTPIPSPREGGANLQGKSSLCYGFPSHSNLLVNNKRTTTLTSPQGRGARTYKENHHCAMAFQAIATRWLATKRTATLTSPQGKMRTNLQEIIGLITS